MRKGPGYAIVLSDLYEKFAVRVIPGLIRFHYFRDAQAIMREELGSDRKWDPYFTAAEDSVNISGCI